MFEWMPYFRAHNMSWDKPDGTYGTANKPPVEFDFHCALAPALTSMYTYDDTAFSVKTLLPTVSRHLTYWLISLSRLAMADLRILTGSLLCHL